jgi:hypothetical protein
LRRIAIIAAALFATAISAFGQAVPALADAFGLQTAPRVATNGDAAFVIWSDPRNGVNTRIYGSPLDAAGKLTKPEGILIGRDPRLSVSETPVALLPLGNGFVAIWSEPGAAGAVRARRITTAGAFVDAEPVSLVGSGSFIGVHAVGAASNGSSIALLTIEGAYVFDATLNYGAFVPQTQLATIALTASIGSDGTDYLVAGRDAAGRVVAARFTAGGTLLNQSMIDSGAPAPDVARVVWTGTDYAVVTRAQTIRVYRVDAGGVPIAPPLDVVTLSSTFVDVDAAANGSGAFVVVYGDGGNLFAVFVSGNNTITETQSISISLASESAPSVAFDGTKYLAAWQIAQNGAGGIDAASFAPGQPRAEPVSSEQTRSLRVQRRAAGAKSGSRWLVWEEEDGRALPQIMIGAEGSASRALAPSANPQTAPAIAENNNGGALVTWFELRAGLTLVGARIDAAGQLLDTPFVIGTAALASAAPASAAVVHVDDRYLVAFSDTSRVLRIARITDAGALLDPGGRTVIAPRAIDQQILPRFAVARGTLFMIWQNGFPGICDPSGPCAYSPFLGAIRVSRDGVALDAAPQTIAAGSGNFDAASNGDRILIAWDTGFGVMARFLTTDSLGATFTIADNRAFSPAVTSDGSTFTVAWLQPAANSFAFADVLAARVSVDGSLQLFSVDEDHDAQAPFAYTLVGGRQVIGWQRLTENVPRFAFKVLAAPELPLRRRTAKK